MKRILRRTCDWLRSWLASARTDRSLARTRRRMDECEASVRSFYGTLADRRDEIDSAAACWAEAEERMRSLVDDADVLVEKMERALEIERSKVQVLELEVEGLTKVCKAHQERWATEVHNQAAIRGASVGREVE